MIERHYDEEALVTMLDAGTSGTSDPHLRSCDECAEKLETFRLVTDALHDASTWDKRQVSEAPNPNTIATLRAFADAMAAEDAIAETYLAEFLAGPREGWMGKLGAHPEWRTAGMVRRLVAATDRALDTMPAEAVEITALATEIAEHLDPAAHRPDTLARLRGAAWRARAYALFYTGDIAKAEDALRAAASLFDRCQLAEYETARLAIVQAVISRVREQYSISSHAAQSAAETFRSFGDERRTASAELAEVHAWFGTGEYERALQRLIGIERRLQDSDHAQTHALILANLGSCCEKMGRIDDALRYHDAAASLLDDLGIHSESLRTRANVASILAREGRVDEALSRFNDVRVQLRHLGMISAATIIELEMAEVLLDRGDYRQVEEICQRAILDCQAAGLEHTQRALTALAFIREAVSNRTATPKVARHVREYIRRLPEEPQLLFAPPPPEAV